MIDISDTNKYEKLRVDDKGRETYLLKGSFPPTVYTISVLTDNQKKFIDKYISFEKRKDLYDYIIDNNIYGKDKKLYEEICNNGGSEAYIDYSDKIKEFISKFLKVNSNFYDELYSFLNMEQNKEYYKYKIPFKYISKEKAKEIYDEVIGDITFGGI